MRRAVSIFAAAAASAIGFFMTPPPARAQTPAADWRTIETEHFRIHYPAPFAGWAARAAASLEGVHARVEDFIGFAPRGRVDVLVSDPAADANGSAYPFLDRPRIELWSTPPDPESGLGDFRDWTELLVTHEYAHIVHLTRPRNRPGALERILPIPFGPVFFHSPRWVAEGYATLVEGALTGSGRPSSAYRAMVLRRFAAEGKVPSYGSLDGTSGWLGGSMAYLVGSTFLEWLETRTGPGSLRRLWKRMASRRGGGFSAAFRGVFGRPPQDLYDRFRAELTAKAVEQERVLESAGLAEGEKWQRLEGGTAAPQVSPDGGRLLAVRSPRRGESFLAVWSLREDAKARAEQERRLAQERGILSDPAEVADVPETPRPRVPRWTLPRRNGRAAEDPRWMPDGRRVLFSMREPASDGALHRDLFLWEPESGAVERRTHLADLSDADPAPDGASAVAVRNRYGISEVVRVDLSSGRTAVVAAAAAADPWEVWSHPRLSPDGRRIAALLHREGRWRVVILAGASGSNDANRREISLGAGGAVGAPAWSPDGRTLYVATDASGVWELAALDPDAAESDRPFARPLTRVTGGALSPAPEPGGEGLFFLEVTAKGVDLHRLALPASTAAALSDPSPRLPPVLPVLPAEDRPLALSPPGSGHPYRALDTQVLRLFSAFTAGPDGFSTLAGAEGSDVVGRLDWIAAGAFGNAAGPRGATVAAAWSGLPVAIRVQAFSALERPGSQRLVARPELDTERRGGALSLSWQRMFPAGRLRAEAWAAAMRVEMLSEEARFSRSLAGAKLQLDWRRFRGKSGVALRGEAGGESGATRGDAWSRAAAAAGARAAAAGAEVSLTARAGRTGGRPTDLDLFAIGGASSTVVPAAAEANRVPSPALPTGAQLGRRFEGFRAEISGSGSPVLLYAERWRAWSPSPKPDPIRLEGVELRLERLIPLDLPESLSLYAGVARARSREPKFDSIRGYGGVVYRP